MVGGRFVRTRNGAVTAAEPAGHAIRAARVRLGEIPQRKTAVSRVPPGRPAP
jgi:hypothetical protein